MSKISHDLRLFTHVQKITKIYKNFFKILHRYIDFSLPSSTISSYFNSSYYSFLTFLTLYLISFKISQKFFSHETPKTPLAYPSDPYPPMRIHSFIQECIRRSVNKPTQRRPSPATAKKLVLSNLQKHFIIPTPGGGANNGKCATLPIIVAVVPRVGQKQKNGGFDG